MIFLPHFDVFCDKLLNICNGWGGGEGGLQGGAALLQSDPLQVITLHTQEIPQNEIIKAHVLFYSLS